MIITYSKHGRTARDGTNLVGHLLKPENVAIKILGIGNSIATDLAAVVRDMEILRNGSSAKAAFHHLSINPSTDYSEERLLDAADHLRAELDPEGTRPWIVIAHEKARQGSKEGHLHAHLVLGHVDGVGRSLKDGRAKIRTEVVARILEHSNGESPVLSPHHQTVVRFLRERQRADVADWLTSAHGETSSKPKSAFGSKARQAAKRKGFDLPEAKALISTAWSNSNEMEAFKEKLQRLGYGIEPGRKAGVWVVIDARGNTIGALDRLLRLKRQATINLMEKIDGTGSGQPGFTAANDWAWPETVRKIGIYRGAGRAAQAAACVTSASGGRSGSRGGFSDDPSSGESRRMFTNTDRGDADDHLQTRGITRHPANWRAIIILQKVGRAFRATPSEENTIECVARLPLEWSRTDLWGIALQSPPPKYLP